MRMLRWSNLDAVQADCNNSRWQTGASAKVLRVSCFWLPGPLGFRIRVVLLGAFSKVHFMGFVRALVRLLHAKKDPTRSYRCRVGCAGFGPGGTAASGRNLESPALADTPLMGA